MIIPESPIVNAIDYSNKATTTFDLLTIEQHHSEEPSIFQEVTIPNWYYEPCPEVGHRIGLLCLQVGSETICEKPSFIPFSKELPVPFTLGSTGNISLKVWDPKYTSDQPYIIFSSEESLPESVEEINSAQDGYDDVNRPAERMIHFRIKQ